MWKRRIILSTVTVTGGYFIYRWSRNQVVRHSGVKGNEGNLSENKENSSYIYLPENAGYFYESMEASLISWRKHYIPVHWELLMLSKSKDRYVRHKAVKSLSELPKLEKWQYAMIAQACDERTSVALARMQKADKLFFLSPPFRDLEEGNLQAELLHFISSLPLLDADSCVQNLLKQVKATNVLKSDDIQDFEFDYPANVYNLRQKKQSLYFFYKLCLEVFLVLSATKSYRKVLIENGILKTLLKIIKVDENNTVFLSLTAQILANFALEEAYSYIIFISGWIGILAQWTKSPHVEVSLPAAKALANLDRDDYHHSLYDNGIYLLYPFCRESQTNPCADVVFVHGLRGATFWTWRQNDSQRMPNCTQVGESLNISEKSENPKRCLDIQNYTYCWPKDWLAVDFPNLRLMSVDYKTCISNWWSKCPQLIERDSLEVKAQDLIQKLLLSNVGERPIIWVTHSMGGILVKQMLVEASASKERKIKRISEKTVGVIFYSVPHKGTEVANMLHSAPPLFQPSIDISQLQKGSSKLLSLNEQFKKLALEKNIATLSFGETKKSRWGLYWTILVPPDSSDPGFGDFYTLPVDHLSTCKPPYPDSVIYSKVLDFLETNIPAVSENVLHSYHFSNLVMEISKIMCLIP